MIVQQLNLKLCTIDIVEEKKIEKLRIKKIEKNKKKIKEFENKTKNQRVKKYIENFVGY